MSGNDSEATNEKSVSLADELRELLKLNKQKHEDEKKEKIDKVKREVDRMLQNVKEKLIAGEIISKMNYYEIPGYRECESRSQIVDYIGSLGFDVVSEFETFSWK